jgi:hypothetical protein
MGEEADAICGVPYGERSEDRTGIELVLDERSFARRRNRRATRRLRDGSPSGDRVSPHSCQR